MKEKIIKSKLVFWKYCTLTGKITNFRILYNWYKTFIWKEVRLWKKF